MTTVHAKAMAALEHAQGNRQVASRLLMEWIAADDALFHELMQPLLTDAVWAAIRGAVRTVRAQAWNQDELVMQIHPLPSEGGQDCVDGLEAMARTRAKSLLNDFFLHSGVRLGDATADDVRAAITFHQAQARGNVTKAKFLALVLSAMGNAERVRDRLDEGKLSRLRERAKGRPHAKGAA